MLKGIDVTLYEKTQTGTDEADAPVYAETPVTVHNVLVGEPSAEEIHAGHPQGRRPRLERRAGGVLWPALSHLRWRCAGHRTHDPSVLEQESAGGKG